MGLYTVDNFEGTAEVFGFVRKVRCIRTANGVELTLMLASQTEMMSVLTALEKAEIFMGGDFVTDAIQADVQRGATNKTEGSRGSTAQAAPPSPPPAPPATKIAPPDPTPGEKIHAPKTTPAPSTSAVNKQTTLDEQIAWAKERAKVKAQEGEEATNPDCVKCKSAPGIMPEGMCPKCLDESKRPPKQSALDKIKGSVVETPAHNVANVVSTAKPPDTSYGDAPKPVQAALSLNSAPSHVPKELMTCKTGMDVIKSLYALKYTREDAVKFVMENRQHIPAMVSSKTKAELEANNLLGTKGALPLEDRLTSLVEVVYE